MTIVYLIARFLLKIHKITTKYKHNFGTIEVIFKLTTKTKCVPSFYENAFHYANDQHRFLTAPYLDNYF